MASLVLILTDQSGNYIKRKDPTKYPLHITLGYAPDPKKTERLLREMRSDPEDIAVFMAVIMNTVWTANIKSKGKKSIFLESVEAVYEHQLKLHKTLDWILAYKYLEDISKNTRDMHIEVDDVNDPDSLPKRFKLQFAFLGYKGTW